MSDLVINNIALVILLPLWIFLIVMCGRFFAVYVNKNIIYMLTLISSFIGIVFSLVSLLSINTTIEWSIPLIKIDNFVIPFGLRIDKLSLIFASVLFIISFLIQIFSVNYMKNNRKIYRFYALLNLFNFVMASLFFSPNMYQLYLFWEIAGVISYLLIGFEYNKAEKSISSKRVFLINKFGDTSLIGGLIITSALVSEYIHNNSLYALSLMI